ncbi:hypothetical protein DKG77_08975 [Flagellimonas aquimarina]|uniref:Uncharacterized protein n=1 Tax=Flagellimonas aquimarina TaxID=2201895 RepID=A0A316KX50_9FLAO|nr:hypothetical protein DKG77_08975 [Allomuricauda koreensis]
MVNETSSQQDFSNSVSMPSESISIPHVFAFAKNATSTTLPIHRCLSTVHETVDNKTNRVSIDDRI